MNTLILSRLRMFAVLLCVCAISACNNDEPSTVSLAIGKVARVNDCHIILDLVRVHERDIAPIADFRYVCGAPESALQQKQWWGTQPEPLMFSMYAGDCVRLDQKFYCVESIEPGASASLKAAYEVKHRQGDLIQRIR